MKPLPPDQSSPDEGKTEENRVEIGEFPFPLQNGPRESRYLTWLRNHSNYLLRNGIADYLRIIAVLARGIFLNFLILLPYFIFIGVALAIYHINWSQPRHVEFAFTSAEEMGGGAGTFAETLDITVTSNFGESQIYTTRFDRSAQNIADSMINLGIELFDLGPDIFPRIEWTLGFGEIIAKNSVSGGTVTFKTDDLQFDNVSRTFPGRSISRTLLFLAAGVVILYPIVIRMSRVRRHRRALRTGHYSSVKRRDFYERAFGTLLMVMIVVAVIEFFPLLTAYFHAVRKGDVAIALPTLATLVGGIVAANRVLPRLGGWTKRLAIMVVGLLGLAIPLLVILFVVEFLVYASEADPKGAWDERLVIALMAPPALFAFLLFLTWLIGLRSFRIRGHLQVVGLGLAMIVLAAAVHAGAEQVRQDYPHQLDTYFMIVVALEIMVYCWLAVDINQTSINSLYRDRLASAYLIGVDTQGDIDIEQDISLQEICNYDAGSRAPYHLINAALNLQSSKDIGIRDRNSDFFIFSKRFIGSDRTGYCRSENMESVFPQMDLGTAMAVSAAAAAPNMGRTTNPLMVAFLTLLNIRLGFWIPHPDRLEKYLVRKRYVDGDEKDTYLTFANQVFTVELSEIGKRRAQACAPADPRPLAPVLKPTVAHDMVGLALSGGGIRSATFNLGIVQELQRRGIFDHVDYISSVSGGGYLASSLSTLMRHRVAPYAEFDGTLEIEDPKRPHLTLTSKDGKRVADLEYAPWARISPDLRDGMKVRAGHTLLRRPGRIGQDRFVSLMDSFSWRVRPGALCREMLSRLDENHDWVNLSDGGHIENLAAMELLRRRCRVIIIGDGECDPNMHFTGLATLIRYARIDLGTDIDVVMDPLRLRKDRKVSKAHFVMCRITYPVDPEIGAEEPETGYLVYLKSSITGDEDEIIHEYRDRNPDFPHESTADQMFDEGQFEAYRALGEHVAKSALPAEKDGAPERMGFDDLLRWAMQAEYPDYGPPGSAPGRVPAGQDQARGAAG